MKDLTANAKLNPWAELDARGRRLDDLSALIRLWSAAKDDLDEALANPLNTEADMQRHRRRFAEACHQLQQTTRTLLTQE
jgi:hypothetical protein